MTTLAGNLGLPRAGYFRSGFKFGLALAAVVAVVHAVGGNFANEWDGWDVALSNAAMALLMGLFVMALTFGVVVRRALRTSDGARNRPARASLGTAIFGIASYVVFFTGAPPIVGAGAIALGIEGLRRSRTLGSGRSLAVAGLILGIVNVGFALSFYAAEITSGVLEHWV